MENRQAPRLPERGIQQLDQLRQDIERLQQQIRQLEAFDASSVNARWATETRAMQAQIAATLAKTFGDGTAEYNKYAAAARLDNGPMYISGRPPTELVAQWIEDGKAKSLGLLNQAVKSLQHNLSELEEKPSFQPGADKAPSRGVARWGGDPAEDEIDKKLRLISAAALVLSACVLLFHPRQAKTKPQESRGVVACKNCGTQIALSNTSTIQQEFNAKCPACGTSSFYKQVEVKPAENAQLK